MISNKTLKDMGIDIIEDGTHIKKYRRFSYMGTELPYLSGDIDDYNTLIHSVYMSGRLSVQNEVKRALSIIDPNLREY